MNEPITSTELKGPLKPLDLLVLLADHARLIVWSALGAGVIALAVAFIVPPTYTATTRILPPQQQQSSAAMLATQLGALAGLAGANIVRNPLETYVALVKSRTIADRLIDRFKLKEVFGDKYFEDARRTLENRTNVTFGKEGVITIEVDDKDPGRAAQIANAYVEELQRLTGQLAITEAQQRRVFFEKQLQQSRENLKKAELELSQVGAGEALIKSAPQAMVEAIARLKAQVTLQEIKLSTMKGFLTENNPEYQLAQRELTSLRSQLVEAERAQPTKGQQNQEYLNRYRDFKYNELLFEQMAKQYEVARIDEAREGAVVQVVDVASPPERKSKPKRGLVAVLTTILTGLALSFFVLFRELFRHNISARPSEASKWAHIVSGLKRLARRP